MQHLLTLLQFQQNQYSYRSQFPVSLLTNAMTILVIFLDL